MSRSAERKHSPDPRYASLSHSMEREKDAFSAELLSRQDSRRSRAGLERRLAAHKFHHHQEATSEMDFGRSIYSTNHA